MLTRNMLEIFIEAFFWYHLQQISQMEACYRSGHQLNWTSGQGHRRSEASQTSVMCRTDSSTAYDPSQPWKTR